MGKVKDFLANELIDQVLEAAIALIAISFGINYFLLADYWIDATGALAKNAGLVGSSSSEIGMMIDTIASTFPFNYISGTGLTNVFIAGTVMITIGLMIKILTTDSRAELVKDFGKILIIPGIIGVVSLIFIQFITANSINNLFNEATLRMTENIVGRVSPGIFVWNMMGMLFLLGLFLLFLGYIIVYTIRKIGGKPVTLYIIGDSMVILGWFTLVFYLFFRILAIEQIATLLYGSQVLKLFTLMWYMSRSGFLVSLCLFAFGLALHKYGRRLERTSFGRERPDLVKTVKRTIQGTPKVHRLPEGYVRLTLPSEKRGRRGFY